MRGAANSGDLGLRPIGAVRGRLACAGCAAITLAMAMTLTFRRPDAAPAVAWRGSDRAVGGTIAGIGLMMMGFALAT